MASGTRRHIAERIQEWSNKEWSKEIIEGERDGLNVTSRDVLHPSVAPPPNAALSRAGTNAQETTRRFAASASNTKLDRYSLSCARKHGASKKYHKAKNWRHDQHQQSNICLSHIHHRWNGPNQIVEHYWGS